MIIKIFGMEVKMFSNKGANIPEAMIIARSKLKFKIII
jgi:hypothetical protein